MAGVGSSCVISRLTWLLSASFSYLCLSLMFAIDVDRAAASSSGCRALLTSEYDCARLGTRLGGLGAVLIGCWKIEPSGSEVEILLCLREWFTSIPCG